MKKTYWWRNTYLLVVFVLMIISYIFGHRILFNPCEYIFNVLNYDICFSTTAQSIGKPLFIYSFFMLIISPFLFLISDKIFLKWLKFAAVWFGVTAILVAISPEYSGGYIGFKPTKEIVSIS